LHGFLRQIYHLILILKVFRISGEAVIYRPCAFPSFEVAIDVIIITIIMIVVVVVVIIIQDGLKLKREPKTTRTTSPEWQ